MSEDWTVKSQAGLINKKTNEVGPGRHTLLFRGIAVDTAKGVDGKRTLEAQAKFANERSLEPKHDTCQADDRSYKTSVRDLEEIEEKRRVEELRKEWAK